MTADPVRVLVAGPNTPHATPCLALKRQLETNPKPAPDGGEVQRPGAATQ
jgi:hypothetical protein